MSYWLNINVLCLLLRNTPVLSGSHHGGTLISTAQAGTEDHITHRNPIPALVAFPVRLRARELCFINTPALGRTGTGPPLFPQLLLGLVEFSLKKRHRCRVARLDLRRLRLSPPFTIYTLPSIFSIYSLYVWRKEGRAVAPKDAYVLIPSTSHDKRDFAIKDREVGTLSCLPV